MMGRKFWELFLPPKPPVATSNRLDESQTVVELHSKEPGCRIPEFSPYSARVPWHTGPRALFSRLFPKYGHYCGPNWSSGKDRGSLLWDKRPVDWLDYCCYCHDIGYDSHNQADLHKADLALLECLENMPKAGWSNPQGNALITGFYRSACIIGLRAVLIPYRKMLVGNTEKKGQISAKKALIKIST